MESLPEEFVKNLALMKELDEKVEELEVRFDKTL